MAGAFSLEQLRGMRGKDVFDVEGQKLGGIENIYLDQETRQPEWIGLSAGLFGSKRLVVPLEGASPTEKGLQVRFPKDKVKDAPSIQADEIDQDQEGQLYRHYGLRYTHEPSRSGPPEGRAPQQGPARAEPGDGRTKSDE
jgi:sporulation protein YlmC with PRC-barrel domain